MKVPLRYQVTNYDCGCTSLLNGLSILFEREEIPPEVMRRVILCSMDQFGDDSVMGRKGTSHEAMAYIAHWLETCGQAGKLDLTCRYLTGEEVSLSEGGALRKAIERGGVATVFIDLDGWHFILLTGLEGDRVYAFDPWILPEPFPVPDVQTDYDHPYRYNRIVPLSRVESTDIHPYSLAPYETRCAVVMEKGRTQR